MKKRIARLIAIGVLTAGMIYLLNRLIDYRADKKNILPMKGRFFTWRDYDIFYNVKGSGSPILLVHDLLPTASSYEWTRLVRRLEKNHTVYMIDLIGCGRSDKPAITYTTFFYAEMLGSFLEQIIGEKTILIASGASAFPAIMADKLHRDKIDKVILLNPERISTAEEQPTLKSKLLKTLISLPIIGTYIYNIETAEGNLDHLFRERYFLKPQLVEERTVGAYYEAAHRGHGTGRFLLASLRGHYLNVNIRLALRELDNLYAIGSRDRKGSVTILGEYRKYSKKIETASVSGSKTLPQLEAPDKLMQVLKLFLQEA